MRARLRTIWRRVQRVWITLGISATLVFTAWSLIAYRASGAARDALRSDASVTVAREATSLAFAPAGRRPRADVGLLFIPGSLVDPVAYAPLARAAAEAGFPAVIVELPRRGAFGGADGVEPGARAHAAMARAGRPRRWVVAGHSRGGVVATNLVGDAPGEFAALVLIGTSHPRDRSLAALRIPVTKIVGTRDGLASPAEVRTNRHLLPASTHWIWIDGGNHSHFGWYGFQPGDHRSTIPAGAQRALMIEGVIAELRHAVAPA
jgi:pimeloyl-ACP methyl ester carboxylesterase